MDSSKSVTKKWKSGRSNQMDEIRLFKRSELQQENGTAVFKPDRRTRHCVLEGIHLFSEWSLKRNRLLPLWTLQWPALNLGTDAEERHHLVAQALQVLVTAQHICTHWTIIHSFIPTETAHCKMQCKNSKQFSLWMSTNKFSLCIKADRKSFATF